MGSPVDLWGDFDPPAPTPPTRWYWARSRPPTGGGARSEPPPKVRRGSVARAARPRTFLASSVPKRRRQQISCTNAKTPKTLCYGIRRSKPQKKCGGAELRLTPATSRPCPWAGLGGPQNGVERPAVTAQNEDLTNVFSDNDRARTRIRRVPRPPERAGSMEPPQEPRLSTRHRAPGAQVVP